MNEFCAPVDQFESGPDVLARRFRTNLPEVLRRIASVPERDDLGLIVVDASGSILFHKPIDGFAILLVWWGLSMVAASPPGHIDRFCAV
ncbi:MAG: hypothetical protein GDA36_06675 [Rhodobacteraceae bacterium]|nr:hypothetical protein [Paracoccaceae bacterium]